MDDRDTRKLMLCARDVLVAIMLPWHVSQDQRQAINDMRDKLESAAGSTIDDDSIIALLEEALAVAQRVADTTTGVHSVHLKMDRARLTMNCILETLRRQR